MPSGRSKEDTWNAKELEKSIKDSKDDRQRSKDKDRDRHRDKDRDRDRDKPRDKDRDRDREKRREKDRDRDKPREKDRDREHRRRDKDEDRKERRHQDKENGHRDDKHRSKRADELPQDYNEEPRRHRKYKEYYDEDIDPDREKRRERRHRDKDEDPERRRERRHKERDEDYYVEWGASKEEKKERRHRDDRDDKRDRDRDRDRRDKDKDKDRRRDKDERRRHRDRDENEESRHKDRDEEDDHERRRRERKERKKREQEEKERQEKEQKEKEKRSQAEFISPPPQPDSNVLNRTWTYDDPSTTEVQNLYDGYESDFEPATESSRSSSCAMPSAVPVSSTRSADLFLESHHSLREKSSHDVGHDNPAMSHRTKSQLESKSDTKLFEDPTNIRPSEHSVAHVASSSNDEEEVEKVPVAVSLSRKPSLTSVHSLTLQKQPSSKSVVRKFSSSQKESDNSMHSISLTKHKRANADLKSEKDSKATLVTKNEKTSAAPSKVDLDQQPATSCSTSSGTVSNRVHAAAAEDQYVGTTLRTGEKIVSMESLLARSGARRKRSYPKVEKSSKGRAQPQQILSKKSKETAVEGKDSNIDRVKTSEVQLQASNANDEDTEVPEEIQKPVEEIDTSNLKMFGSLNQGLDEILKNYEKAGSEREPQEKPKEPLDLENSKEQNQPLEQEQPHQQQQRNSSQQQRSATQQQKSISPKAQPSKQTQELKPSKPEVRLPVQGRIPKQQQKSPTQQQKTPPQQKNTPPAQQRRPSLQQERSMKNSPTKTPADGKSPAAPKGTSSRSRRSSTSGPGKDSSPGKGQPSAGRGSAPATRGRTTDGSSRRGSMKEMPYSKNTRMSPQSYGKGKMDDSTKPRQNERRRSDPGNVQKGSRNPPRKGDGGHSKNTDTKASVRSRDTLKKANIDPKQRRGSTHDGSSKEKINDKRLKPGTRKTQEDAIFDEAISLMQAEDLLKVTDDHNQLAESNAAIRYKSLSRSSSQHERSPTPWDKSGSGHDLVLKSGSSGLLNAGSFAEEEEDDYNYDDEDFEDYADDFEDDADDFDDEDDDDDSRHSSQKQNGTSKHRDNDDEMDDILKAMNKENDRLMADNERNQRQQRDRDRASSPPRSQRPPSGRTFINFSSARQRAVSSKAASKAARRGIELLQMVEMDTAAYDMFDMPPVTEYNMYMRSFGSSNTKQAYIQTNDDNIDRELQTEEIEYTDKWCQHPPAEILSCGGPDDTSSPDAAYQPIDAPDLGAFLDAAGQVMCVLMEEAALSRRDTRDAHGTDTKQSDIVVSDAFSELNVPGFLSDRPVIHSHISAVQTHMLITVHQTPDKPSSDQLKRQGCLCVWNINEPSQPQKILVCESRPQCCCFSPTKTSLVFSGMRDGSVVVWDLREAASMHRSHRARGKEWTLRGPTYNTAGILAYDNHQSGVMAVHPIVAAGESESASLSGLSQSDSSEGLSFQLATLEENGIMNLWVVVELLTPDLAGSESDFGLAPGGKVRLVKSSTINLDNPLRDIRLRTTMKCADLQLLPANNSHYFVASDTGCVIHGLRYGGKAPPRAYRPLVDNPVQITTIDFSPFTEPVFLTGCADGSLRLYHVDTEWPLVVWLSSTSGRPIQRVAWCRSRPAVFFVLDADAKLYIWDLLMDDSGPLKQEAIAQSRVTSLALSNDHSATGLGLPGRRPQMVVCLESGACEVHTISQQFSALMADEMDQFSAFLQRNS